VSVTLAEHEGDITETSLANEQHLTGTLTGTWPGPKRDLTGARQHEVHSETTERHRREEAPHFLMADY